MAPPNDLNIGECYCVSGRQRYGAKYSTSVPWQCDFEPLASPVHPSPVSPSDFPIDLLQGDENIEADEDDEGDENDEDDTDDDPVGGLWDDNEGDEINEEPQSDESDESDDEDGIPRIAPWRLNLTALSQRYNMYAVAYRKKVHISRIRSVVDHTVPTNPDLVLEPPTSPNALLVGGYIDRNMPHQINHLIMGDLGDEEILLLAYDDGDVIGYYNFQIEKALLRIESGNALKHSTPVAPFFHQNTGISTWGLAIHKQSRLIAAGNNSKEVHVFAFALSPEATPGEHLTTGKHDLFHVRRKEPSLQDWCVDAFDIELKTRRNVNCCFVFEIKRGDNIPNVAFSNDADGSADKVLAIDIRGRLWVLDIWSSRAQCINGLYESYSRSKRLRVHQLLFPQRGWGVLVLPQSSFLPTSTFEESLGLEPGEADYAVSDHYGYYIGTENAFKHIQDNSILHPWVRATYRNDSSLTQLLRERRARGVWHDDTRSTHWHAGRDLAVDGYSESASSPANRITNAGFQGITLPDGSSVMRTYELDIELVGSDFDVGIMFSNAINQLKPREMNIPGLYFAGERLAHLIHVPDLSLVVAGSMCGRAALITLTRPRNPHYSFKRGFKIEAILPRSTDESRQLRPISPLLGVTIGPIPNRGLGKHHYRIILQYYDHRILAYDICRNTNTNELSVI